MSEQPPLDLRALADVDPPEVVREALRTFRRRIVTRYVWLALAIVVFGAAVLWGRTPTTLQQRVDSARPAAFVDAVWRVEGATVALDKVVDLGDRIGLHLVAVPDDPDHRVEIFVSGQIAGERVDSWDRYLEVEPTDDDPTLTVSVRGASSRFPLLGAGGIPDSVWKEFR
jgi:hypothetical protein